MADLDKQIDEGQEKWRKGPDLTSITDTGNYIKFKTLEYEYLSYSKPSDKGSQCLKYGIGASKERRSLWKKDLSKYGI
jgi:hypothetical protein